MNFINFSIKDYDVSDFNISPEYKFQDKKSKVYIFGDLIGAIFEKKLFSSEESFDKIVKKINKSDFNGFVSTTIGQYYLVIIQNNNVKILCSPSSPSLFYTFENGIYIFSND